MTPKVTTKRLIQQKADIWLLFCLDGKILLSATDDPLSKRLKRMATDWVRQHPSAAESGSATLLPSWESVPAKRLLIAGLGGNAEFQPISLERAAAAAFKVAVQHGPASIATPLSGLRSIKGLSEHQSAKLVVGALFSGTYSFSLKSDRSKSGKSGLELLFTDAHDKSMAKTRRVLRDAAILGASLNEVRDIANLPGNKATPSAIASSAQRLAKKYGLKCKVMNNADLKKDKCHALLAVAEGSRDGAKMIILRHGPAQSKKKPLVIVGKTITFDTGGISLKQPKGMWWMKYDKSGGMAVLAAMVAVARLKTSRPVIGIMPVAENMPGGAAYRPGDIISSRSGKSIEVLNTDAEGRLALADALSLAQTFKPEAVVDLATLTGAAVVALGHIVAPVMGNDEKLLKALQEAGDACCERIWPLPLLPEYGDALKSDFADMKNIGDGTAGCIAAGAFLQSFVDPDTPWAHIDVAGTAWEENSKPYCSSGVTLFGARLINEWVHQYA